MAKETTSRIKRVNSSMIYLIHCKNFCKRHNVPPPITTIKKIIKKQRQLRAWEKISVSYLWIKD
jgi:hypothetical protein